MKIPDDLKEEYEQQNQTIQFFSGRYELHVAEKEAVREAKKRLLEIERIAKAES